MSGIFTRILTRDKLLVMIGSYTRGICRKMQVVPPPSVVGKTCRPTLTVAARQRNNQEARATARDLLNSSNYHKDTVGSIPNILI